MPSAGRSPNAAISGPTTPPAVFASVSHPVVAAVDKEVRRWRLAAGRTNDTLDAIAVADIRAPAAHSMRCHSADQRAPASDPNAPYEATTAHAAVHAVAGR